MIYIAVTEMKFFRNFTYHKSLHIKDHTTRLDQNPQVNTVLQLSEQHDIT